MSPIRLTRVYGASLREAFPVEDSPAEDLVSLLEQADRGRADGQTCTDGPAN